MSDPLEERSLGTSDCDAGSDYVANLCISTAFQMSNSQSEPSPGLLHCVRPSPCPEMQPTPDPQTFAEESCVDDRAVTLLNITTWETDNATEHVNSNQLTQSEENAVRVESHRPHRPGDQLRDSSIPIGNSTTEKISCKGEPGARVQPLKPKHMCNVCGKLFKRAHNLKIHGRLHSGDKPYRCPFEHCDKEFRWKSSIVSHLNWHRNKKGEQLPGDTGHQSSTLNKRRVFSANQKCHVVQPDVLMHKASVPGGAHFMCPQGSNYAPDLSQGVNTSFEYGSSRKLTDIHIAHDSKEEHLRDPSNFEVHHAGNNAPDILKSWLNTYASEGIREVLNPAERAGNDENGAIHTPSTTVESSQPSPPVLDGRALVSLVPFFPARNGVDESRSAENNESQMQASEKRDPRPYSSTLLLHRNDQVSNSDPDLRQSDTDEREVYGSTSHFNYF